MVTLAQFAWHSGMEIVHTMYHRLHGHHCLVVRMRTKALYACARDCDSLPREGVAQRNVASDRSKYGEDCSRRVRWERNSLEGNQVEYDGPRSHKEVNGTFSPTSLVVHTLSFLSRSVLGRACSFI